MSSDLLAIQLHDGAGFVRGFEPDVKYQRCPHSSVVSELGWGFAAESDRGPQL